MSSAPTAELPVPAPADERSAEELLDIVSLHLLRAGVPPTHVGARLADCPQFRPEDFQGGMVLSGRAGTGKTYVAAAALAEVHARAIRFANAVDLAHRLRRSVKAEGDLNDLLDPLLSAEYLVLDDLGAQMATEFTQEHLYLVLGDRLGRRRWTMVTTNLLREELAQTFGDRIASRLSSMNPTVIEGPDRRKHQSPREPEPPKPRVNRCHQHDAFAYGKTAAGSLFRRCRRCCLDEEYAAGNRWVPVNPASQKEVLVPDETRFKGRIYEALRQMPLYARDEAFCRHWLPLARAMRDQYPGFDWISAVREAHQAEADGRQKPSQRLLYVSGWVARRWDEGRRKGIPKRRGHGPDAPMRETVGRMVSGVRPSTEGEVRVPEGTLKG